jgi:phytoene dehydrogenase-like protein
MYDTLIIGRDLSSLIAALTCVRKGRKTVLVMEGNPENVYREAGYAFPFDPRPLSGLANRQLFSRLISDMLPAGDDIPPSGILNPAFQVVLSGHRVDFFSDRGQLIDDLIREFPEQKRDIERFYRAVEKVGNLVERWIAEDETGRPGWAIDILRRLVRLPAAIAGRYSLLLRDNEKGVVFKRVLQAQLNFLSHLELEGHPFPLAAAYLISLPSRGLFYPRGGIIAWTDRLRQAFTDHGGILKHGCSVIRIETEPGIAVDLKCEGSSSTLRGRKLIVSAQWEKLELLLPVRKVLPGLNRRFASVRSVAYPFCLHMGIHERGLPENMASDVVVLRDGNGPVTNRDLVFLKTSLLGETDRAPEGRRAVSATVYLADSPLRLNDQELKVAAMGIIDSLEEFLPFLRDNIDYLRVDQSIFLSRRYQELVNRKYRTRRRPLFGLRTLSPKTRLPNVLLTGGILRAGLGFEGEVIAGMDAAFQSEQGN